jgi:hypothetical protein
VNPAAEWLRARFEQLIKYREIARGNGLRYEITFGRWHGPSAVRPMIEFRSVMETGESMTVKPVDYKDPERWWL